MNLILASLATALPIYIGYRIFYKPPRSPRVYINSLSDEQKEKLYYPLDFFPNGEFIKSPYGYIRAYRFGPLGGKKVLFLHGLTCPCPIFRDLANKCVESGFQVLLFDFFGRGYSDAPMDLPYDQRLYISQILAVLSHYQWVEFDLIGYSMGGAIATYFTNCYPALVQKLVLIAPAGLLTRNTIPFVSRIGLCLHVPLSLVYALSSLMSLEPGKYPKEEGRFTDDIVIEQRLLNPAVGWAVLSTLRHSPLFDQEDMFRSFENREVLIVWGQDDTIVPISGFTRMKSLGLNIKELLLENAGHDLIWSRTRQVCGGILEYLKSPAM